MMGLGAAVQVKDEWTVDWIFKDDYWVIQVINVHSYYIPSSSVRLFSPESYFYRKEREYLSWAETGLSLVLLQESH